MLWLDTALDTSRKGCYVLLPSTIHLLFVGPARVKVRVCSIRIPTAWADRIQSGIKQPQSVSHFGMLRGIGALDLVPSQR
jgi:hypothetical protein